MPTVAMTGRRRFGGFNAAKSVSVSECVIGGCGVTRRSRGNDSIHAPPIAPAAPTIPTPLHAKRRNFM
jgi:hypothetical protein